MGKEKAKKGTSMKGTTPVKLNVKYVYAGPTNPTEDDKRVQQAHYDRLLELFRTLLRKGKDGIDI